MGQGWEDGLGVHELFPPSWQVWGSGQKVVCLILAETPSEALRVEREERVAE